MQQAFALTEPAEKTANSGIATHLVIYLAPHRLGVDPNTLE